MASSIPSKDNDTMGAITIKKEMDDEEDQIEIEHLTEDIHDSDAINSQPHIAIKQGAVIKMEMIDSPEDGAAAVLNPVVVEEIPLTKYCRHLILANHPVGKKVRCGVCGSLVNIWASRKYVSAQNALSHALSHMAIPSYQCKYCDFGAATSWNMPYHLRVHGLVTKFAVHYTDTTNENREEIMEMLQLCYGKTGEEQRLKHKKNSGSSTTVKALIAAKNSGDSNLPVVKEVLNDLMPINHVIPSLVSRKRPASTGENENGSDALMKATLAYMKDRVY